MPEPLKNSSTLTLPELYSSIIRWVGGLAPDGSVSEELEVAVRLLLRARAKRFGPSTHRRIVGIVGPERDSYAARFLNSGAQLDDVIDERAVELGRPFRPAQGAVTRHDHGRASRRSRVRHSRRFSYDKMPAALIASRTSRVE